MNDTMGGIKWPHFLYSRSRVVVHQSEVKSKTVVFYSEINFVRFIVRAHATYIFSFQVKFQSVYPKYCEPVERYRI